jgi:hypothetical protein
MVSRCSSNLRNDGAFFILIRHSTVSISHIGFYIATGIPF